MTELGSEIPANESLGHGSGEEPRKPVRGALQRGHVARQRPVVLFIEDFAELPRSSQEALRVLARHLQTRAEHPDGRRLPRLLLVLDHGADDPSDLLIPDARDPRRPCVAVSAFDGSETEAFLASRLDPRRVQRSGDAPADGTWHRPRERRPIAGRVGGPGGRRERPPSRSRRGR